MSGGAAGRTVLIVEPHLEGRFGHPWRYTHALTKRFAAAGWPVRILAHAIYDGPARIAGAPVEPVFPRSYYEREDRDAKGLRWRLRRWRSERTQSTLSPFAAIVRDAIVRARRGGGDVRLVVPTATPAILSELLSLSVLIDGALPPAALLFHEEPDLYTDWYRPLRLEVLRERLAGSGWGDGLRCFATNAPLARHLADLLGVPVEAAGDLADEVEIAVLRAAAAQPPRLARPEPAADVVDHLLRLKADGRRIAWCPGQMRPDKGSDRLPLLVAAMEAQAATPGAPAFHLVVQVPTAPDRRLPAVEALGRHPRVTVIRGEISDAAYYALLGLADVVVLPYDARLYARRISRVLVEASHAGRPLLASAGMAAEDEEAGRRCVAFLDDWAAWPAHAAALLDRAGAAADRAEAPDRAAGAPLCWHGLADWIVAARRPGVAPRPALYVRPAALDADAAALAEAHLAHLAARGVPVVELLVAATRGRRRTLQRTMLAGRAGSPAQLTAWAASPSGGLAGLVQRLAALAARLRRGIAVRQGRSRTPRLVGPVVHEIAARRGFAFVVVLAAGAGDAIEVRWRGAPVWTETAGDRSADESFAARVDAARAGLIRPA
ncbi:hypothetical protein PQJ75_06935 [Rhodoplanes sp. TEM]|uniref:Glycosyltransferase subfamily 4-like N-terminal domain-containing protein n=1 Tax=Rhodoplanes tepidamans TaxID=200616 RepID=A0ABT5J4Q6_RHOTP|nr:MULTISPECIES: hypothetical protein [Rhodoplanes]MDC7784432.1 hypothetical protein [Rhodoplanes tepidamans]MDC7983462.1 hypothetical protein [Rhodoplanes sp. TEM]MDQ0356939.1 glycosyltransferase involved in cell wall biosynthesis [Rhodoplanes tepidamans]